MTFSVRPAAGDGWLAFASGSRLLVVPPPSDATVIESVFAALQSADGFQAVLDLLTAKGLSATPSFALVEWETGRDARLIVRGDSALAVTDAAGPQSLSATGVSTWLERTMPGVTGIGFAVPGATPAGTVHLPLESGVALVCEVVVGAAVVATAAVSTAPAPAGHVVAPVPAVAPVSDVDVEATVREMPEVSEPAEPSTPVTPESSTSGYDYLFGDTMYRSVADAAVRPPEGDAAEGEAGAAASDAPISGDHDGETVLTSDIAKIRGQRKSRAATPTPPPPPAPKLVLVVAPSGVREPLTQVILVGRSPSVSKVSGGQIPRLVTVGTADQDISRNHAQFSLEGGTVVVTDLHSRNGTSIVLPGKTPQKLRAGEPTSVLVGTVIDLGGGVTLTVDEDS